MPTYTSGPVLGIKNRTPLVKLGTEKLQELWTQMRRNRDPLHVIKIAQGIEPARTQAEKRLKKIHSLLLERGCDPLRV